MGIDNPQSRPNGPTRPAWRALVLVAMLAVGLGGCARLVPIDRPAEQTAAPSVAPVWEMLDADHPDDWFVLLNEGPEALDWRLRAIDTATQSLDLQTFLWAFDTVGAQVLDRLIAAADRGVRVKLLVDDTFLAGEDGILLALHRHPNIQYRVYNPFKRRADGIVSRWALNLGEFHRLDHRMHNKVMVVDNRVAIVGGRNIADEYFGLHSDANFRDMELIVGGPVVPRITRTFDDYWNDRWSFPIDELSHVQTVPAALDDLRAKARGPQARYEPETPAQRREQWRDLVASSRQGQARLLVDRPPREDPASASDAPTQVADALVEIFDQAQREVIIVSAYLIPTPRLETLVGRAIDRGVRIRILTNSISSNNHLAAHSAYHNHVRALLHGGVELHEVKTDAKARPLYMLLPVDTKALALHAKALIIDDRQVFIGSANLDPRSLRINTEVGLLVESEALNSDLRDAVQTDFDQANAWRLDLDGEGGVVWVSGDVRLDVQPAASYMQRIEDWFFSLLPIEEEL